MIENLSFKKIYHKPSLNRNQIKEIANEVWKNMMSYRQYKAFESIFRNKRDLNHALTLREGPNGYVPQVFKSPTRVDGFRTVRVNNQVPSKGPKPVAQTQGQCGSKFEFGT